MKVLILGGCGYMGSSAARDLIKSDEVTQVILADRKIDMTNVHESVQNSQKISTLNLDVTDFQALVKAMRDSDVVVNDVGPYSKFGIKPVEAAIAAGVSYVDICDDCNVTKEIFKLDESAKKAGVSICTGFGGSPGITNILARFAADKLDNVDEIRVLWTVALNDSFGQAGLTQAMSQFIGNVTQYIDGQWVDVPAGSGGEEVDFTGSLGKTQVYYAAHPEALTLPRYIPGVNTVVEKGGFFPPWVSKMFMELINLGFVSAETLTVGNTTMTSKELMALIVQNAAGFWNQVEQYEFSPVDIIVKGRESGKRVAHAYHLAGSAAPGIAMLTSMCARMLYRGDIKARGVVAPEGAADPRMFLGEFVKRGVRFFEEKTVEQGVTLLVEVKLE